MASDSKTRTEVDVLADIAENDSKLAHHDEFIARIVASFKSDADEYLNKLSKTCLSLPDAGDLEPVRRSVPANNIGPAIEPLRGVLSVLVMANIEDVVRVLAPAIPTGGVKAADRARRRRELVEELKQVGTAAERLAEKSEGRGYVGRPSYRDPAVFSNFKSAESWDRIKVGKARRHFLGLGKNLSEINRELAICRSEIVTLREWERATSDAQQRSEAQRKIRIQEARAEAFRVDLASVQRDADEANNFLANLERFFSEAGVNLDF